MAANRGQNAARESLKNKGFSRSKQKYEIKTNDGQSLGKVSYGAYQAIRYNTLDRYTPKNDNEKKVIESYKNHTYGEGNYEIYKKYGVNPSTFSFDDLYELSPSLGYEAWTNSDKSLKKDTYSPAKGISKTQKKDFNALYALAQNNQNSKDSKKDKGRFAAFQNNLKSGITFGAYDFFEDKEEKSAHKKGGMPEENRVTSKQAQRTTNASHPIASEAGQEIGSTASMLALGNGIGGLTKVLPWFGKLPQFAQHAINSGLTFATINGAEKGFSGGDLKDIAKSAGIGGAGGAAGGMASYGVGKVGEKVIFSKGLQKLLSNKELQHKVVPEIIRSGSAGATFAGADTATTYYLRPENERPDARQIRKQILTGFAFGAITSGIEAINASDASREYLDDLNTKMMSDYEKMARATGASNENIVGKKRLAENVIKYNEVMKAYLNNDSVGVDIDGKLYEFPESRARFLGQDKYVKAIKDNLDIVTTNAKSFLEGMTEGETTGTARTASVPDSTGLIPAATGAVSEATTGDGVSAVRPNNTKLYAPARSGSAEFAADRATADSSVVTSVAKPVSVQPINPELSTRGETSAANDIITANRPIDRSAPDAAQTAQNASAPVNRVTQNVQPVNAGNNINKPFTRQETSVLVRGKHVMSYNTGGGSYIVNSNMALKVDNKNNSKIGEEYKKQTSFDVEPVDVGVEDIIQSVMDGNGIGTVDGYRVDDGIYVINNNGKDYSFAKAYADILQSRSASLELVDSGTDLGVALAGYDDKGDIVGFTWGIKREYNPINAGLKNSVVQAVKNTLNYGLSDTQRLINMFQDQTGGDGMSGIADYLIAKGDVGDYGAFFTDGGAAVNSIIRNGVNNNGNERFISERTDITDGSVERGNGERSGEPRRSIPYGAGEIEDAVRTGATDTEIPDSRQTFTENFERQGTLIQRSIQTSGGDIVYREIPANSVTNDAEAQRIISLNNSRGVKTVFMSGYATLGNVRTRGFAIGDTVYVMYDNDTYSPTQINEHEIVHCKAGTDTYTTLRDKVLGSLSSGERLWVYNRVRDTYANEAAQYIRDIVRADPGISESDAAQLFDEYIWEEIIADLNGGMGAMAEYTERFAEDIARFRGETATAAETENIPETGAESMANASPAEYAEEIDGGGVKYSIANIKGNGGNYGMGVYLDTNIFNGVKPRDWNKTLKNYVYNNLAGSEINVIDSEGNTETIYLAKPNERVYKNGKGHKVIDKLAYSRGNANALSIVHIDELLQTATNNGTNTENSHGWLDKSGWEFKKAYLQDINGNIYETTLNIAKAEDGRNVLYSLSNTKKIDAGNVPSTLKGRSLPNNHQSSDTTISHPNPFVKKFSSVDRTNQTTTLEFKNWFGDWERDPQNASKVVNDEGTPKVMYHGTDADFTAFDRTKGRSSMDIQGMFFSPWEIDAGGYGNNVGAYYLNIKNPASGEEAFKALNKFKGQNYAGIKAREYLENQGYDGVNFYDEEFVAFYPTQIKSATGNIGTFDLVNPDIRYSIENLDTQNLLQQIAEDIGYHEGLIEASKKNKTEVRELLNDNKRLKTSLENAKRQMVRTKIPRSNRTVVGKATREIIKSLSSKTNAQEITPRVIEVYDTYFKEMHEAGCVAELEQKAAENMAMAFQDIAADIIAEGEEWTSDEDYKDLVTYLRSSHIKVPDNVKADIHYNEFRKAHFGTMTLANDGVPVDIIYQELCDIFPHLFSDKVANPADQIEEIASVVDSIRPRAYNPHERYAEDSLEFAVEQFTAIVDDVVEKKTKADKMHEKAQQDKAAALQKEREAFEKRYEKLRTEAKEKADRQRYINYWDKRLAVEDVKNQKDAVIANIRERRKVSILKAHIRKTANDLSSRLKNPKGAPAELVKSIADICSKLDFTTDRLGKNGGENKSNLDLLELKKKYDALKKDPDYDISSEHDEELSQSIAELDDVIGKKRIVDLDVQELTDLDTILKQIKYTIINANKQIGKANALENKQLGIRVINELNEQKGFNRNIATRLMTLVSSQVLNPMRMAEMMSGYKTDSTFYGMFKDLNDGVRKQAKFKMDASKPFDELVNGKGNGKLHEKFNTELVDTGMKFKDGTSVKIPKSMMCELVMLWDRKQGRSHLEKGGFTVPDFKSYNKGKIREAFTTGQKTVFNVSEADIVRIRGMLDKYDKLWIERARAFFNGSAQKAVNEVSMLLKGRKVATAANYIPIHSDKNYVRTENEGVKLDASIEGSGTLKSVVENAPQPLDLMGLPYTVTEHIDFVAKYAGLAIPIRNFNKIYNVNTVSDSGEGDSVKNAVGQKWGANMVEYGIDQLLTDLQTTRQTPKGPLSKGTVQSNWVAATLNANISVCIKQAASYPTAAYVVGMKPLAKALKARTGIKKADLQAEIDAHTGLHYLRRIGLSTQELGDRAGSNNLIKRVTDKIDRSLTDKGVSSGILPSNWIQSVDVATTETLWLAAKYYVADELGISQDSSNYWDEVTRTFETIIEETQPNYDVMHRPEIQKTTNAMLRAMIMFQTQPLQNSGILYSSIGAISAKNAEYKAAKEAYEQNRTSANKARLDEAKRQSNAARARCARASAALVTSAITFVMMTALARFVLHNVRRYRDKDGEVSVKKVLMGALGDLKDQAITTIFPVGGNIASELVSNTLNGYDYEIPTTQMLNNLKDAAIGVWDVYKDLTGKDAYLPTIEKLKKLRDAANDLLKVTGELTGVPVTNAENIGVSVWKYIKDAINGELFSSDASEYKPKYVYGYADLAGAIVSGNGKKEAKIKGYFADYEREINKGSLTRYLKPAYKEYVESDPQAARRIKNTLISDYGYTEKTIDSWLEDDEEKE